MPISIFFSLLNLAISARLLASNCSFTDYRSAGSMTLGRLPAATDQTTGRATGQATGQVTPSSCGV